MNQGLGKLEIRFVAVALAALLLYSVAHLAVQIHQQSVSDYVTYWFASTYINQHPGFDIYSIAGEREMHRSFAGHPLHKQLIEQFENTQTPFFYWLIGLLKTGDVSRDSRIFQTLSLAAFGIAILYFLSQNQVSINTGLAISLYIVVLFPPFRFDVANANVNRLLVSSIALSLWLAGQYRRRASFVSWAVWGLAVAFKPTIVMAPILLFCSHVVRRQLVLLRAEATGFLTGLIAAFLAGSFFCGSWSCWHSWLARIVSLPLSASPLEHFNFSLPVLCAERMNYDVAGVTMLVFLPLSFLTPLILIYRASMRHRGEPGRSRQRDSDRDLDHLVVCIGLLIYLLWSPLVWLHYYLLCLPLLIFLGQRNLVQRPLESWKDFLKAGATGTAVILLSSLTTLFGLGGGNVLLILGVFVWSSTALLFILGLLHLPMLVRRVSADEASTQES